jgi:hypothetical protein
MKNFLCSEPSIIKIGDAIKNVYEGKWTLAPFQRPAKWQWIEQKALLESLLVGIPIGVVYLWKNDPKNDTPMRAVPGIVFDSEKVKAMIIDGQQRLSFLTWLYCKHKNHLFEFGPGDVFFNALKKEFFIKDIQEDIKNGIIKLNDLFGANFNVTSSSTVRNNQDLSTDEKLIITGNIELMHNALTERSIVIQELSASASVGQSFMLYDKVNNAGKPLKGDDYVEAGLFSVNPKLYKKITETVDSLSEYPTHSKKYPFKNLFTRTNIIRSITDDLYHIHNPNERTTVPLKYLIDFDNPQYANSKNAKPKKLSPKVIDDSFTRVKNAFEHYKDILINDMFICDHSGINPTLSIPINALLRNKGRQLDVESKGQFIKWFILFNTHNPYLGSQDKKIKDDCFSAREDNPFPKLMSNLKSHLKRDRNSTLKFMPAMFGPPGSKPTKASAFLYHTNLMIAIYNGANDWFEHQKIEDIKKRTSQDLHKHHIFPQKLYDNTDKFIRDHICNIARIQKRTNSSLNAKEPSNSQYLPAVLKRDQSALDSQQIPLQDNLWKFTRGKGKKFMEERRDLLVKASNKFLDKLELKTWSERDAIGSISSVEEHLKEIEGQYLEFKETMLWMIDKEKGEMDFAYTISKEIAGFMNNGGGDLYIGIKDKIGEDRVVGLQRDFDWLESKYPDCNGQEKWQEIILKRVIADIGKTKYDRINKFEYVSIQNKIIFRISIPHVGDVFLKKYKKMDKSGVFITWKDVLFMRRLDHVYADKRNENGKIIDENGTEVKND